jgi:hypothetical protein
MIMSVLGIGFFWTVWLLIVLVSQVLVAALNWPSTFGLEDHPVPVYLAVGGVASIIWATVYELVFRQPVPSSSVPDGKSRTSTGESIIPAAVGLSALVLAPFLAIALEQGQPAVLVVSLPLVLWTAPLFPLFSFGYTRGQPDIGGFAYRKMPFGLIASAALAGGIWLMQQLGWWTEGIIGSALVLILVAFVGVNLGINLQKGRDESS